MRVEKWLFSILVTWISSLFMYCIKVLNWGSYKERNNKWKKKWVWEHSSNSVIKNQPLFEITDSMAICSISNLVHHTSFVVETSLMITVSSLASTELASPLPPPQDGRQ